MKYTAHIQKVSTGEVITKDFTVDSTDGIWWVWSEGNFSCDCNRAIFFGDEDETCGESRFKVNIEGIVTEF